MLSGTWHARSLGDWRRELNPLSVRAELHAIISAWAGPIQSCLDAASDDDIIVIPAGMYTDSLTLSGAVATTGPLRDARANPCL